MLVQGSSHTLSVANLKDANGQSRDLPAGTFPTFSVTPPEAATLGPQDPQTGKQGFTVSDSYTGPVSFGASYSYPDGDTITFNPANETVAAPEDKTGDVVIDAA